jgi:hypothetical protein
MRVDGSTGLPQFDPDFAGPTDWARMYRDVGLQVVPCRMPDEDQHWKRPAISEWKTLQEELIPEISFLRWYGHDGQYKRRTNMGLITGRCSSNIFVIDLDDHKTPQAALWWTGLLQEHYWGREPHTWQQRTGGGGRQLFFRGPKGWTAPTNKTLIGVDIRGQRGFAVMPPSVHETKQEYAWAPDCAPWEVHIEDAPPWLIRAVEALVAEHGGGSSHTPAERTPSPGNEVDAFGARIDGREEYMRDMVWAAVVDWYRESPIKPPEEESRQKMLATYQTYIRSVKTRFPGVDTEEGLEREGRGLSLFQDKWARAMAQWEPKVQYAAMEARPKEEARTDKPAQGAASAALVVTAEEFVTGFTPPDYLIDGIMQRGYLYSLTAKTGAGKTAITMYLSQCIARGRPVARKEVKQGSVLFLAGENPDDIRARFLVLAEAYGFQPVDIPIHFIAGVVDVAQSLPVIRAAAEAISDLLLVIVDTAAAYFTGDDANSNTQQGAYARVLRELSFLPGKPAVLVNCHPVKNASRENLTPMGGSAFLNEVDGNLTLWASDDKSTLHWQGKFRGPEFEPISFQMETRTSSAVVDSKGRLMPSVVALPISDAELERGEQEKQSEENKLLAVIGMNAGAPISQLAKKAGFVSKSGEPQKSTVFRICQRLKDDKLIILKRGHYRITKAGKSELGWSEDGSEND